MQLPDDYEESGGMSTAVFTAIVSVTLFILLIFVIVLVSNVQSSDGDNEKESLVVQESNTSEESFSAGTLKPEDLDFWDKYSSEEEEDISTETVYESSGTEEEETGDGLSDGYRTLVTFKDGSREWVAINDSIPANRYEPISFIRHGNIMKYFMEDKEVSYAGVRISEESGAVDFEKLKAGGIDFCMIKAGTRGYSTGKIVADEAFKENVEKADAAGLDVGVYFCSQAITVEEAREEASMVLKSMEGLDIKFPVGFDMNDIINDESRTDDLSGNDRTKIARAFMEVIEGAGYHPVLYGDKSWLICELNPAKLSEYDVWYGEHGDIPDYPYKFTMWEYSDSVKIDGISGYARMSISLIDYSRK